MQTNAIQIINKLLTMQYLKGLHGGYLKNLGLGKAGFKKT